MTSLVAPPLSLYVHMPWCVRKCPYCDFNSHTAPDELPQRAYVTALLEDLEQDLDTVQGRSLVSVFFGGGTPSLFAPEFIDAFLTGVRERIHCEPDIEVTLETNPGTVEHGRFDGYKAAGITRVSLGAQSFDESQLQKLGRIHGTRDIHRAVDELVTAGLHNFNIDLMYALPGQQLQQAIDDTRAAIALGPTHISHYQLTLEPGTAFYHRPPLLPDVDTSWDMQVACQTVLAEAGYEQYEVSAYARAGRRCRHNLNYWQFGDYIGIGAGAHGKLTDAARREITRTTRHRMPREYLRQSAPKRTSERRVVVGDELPLEFMLNALRLTDGFSIPDFEARTGLSIDTIAAPLALAQHRQLIAKVDQRWVPTSLGRQFLNDLQAMFLPDSGPTTAAEVDASLASASASS